jgi:F-type H+-transporting ATPase subunit epsilon
MPTVQMNMKILLPFRVFTEKTPVLKIVAETTQGSFGFLPHRLDCAAVLVAGILCYETCDGGEVYMAVDQGVLVKTGFDVLISVRNAIAGNDLADLRDTVRQEFLNRNEQEQNIRSVLAKLETGFSRRFMEFNRG